MLLLVKVNRKRAGDACRTPAQAGPRICVGTKQAPSLFEQTCSEQYCNNKQREKDKEQNLGDRSSARGDASESEYSRNYGDNEENN
jgi:hypothetical protein